MEKFTIFDVLDIEHREEWHFIISIVAFLFGKNFEKNIESKYMKNLE